MPFPNFTNPYRKPADVPENYRKHSNLSKLFKADGAYVRPAEDPVTIWAIDLLHQEYGVPLDALELELSADFSEGTYQGGRRYQGRADVIVYDDRYIGAGGGLDVAFIMVEAMEPSKRFEGTEPEGWVEHLNRLNAYMRASPSARYAILTSGTNTKIYRRDLDYPRALQEIGDLPKYESARSAAAHSPYKVILNPNKVDTQFLHSLLLSQLTLDQVVPLQSSSSLPRVSVSDVLSIKLPIPKDLQKQKEIGKEVEKRRSEVKQLRSQAESVVAAAKARVERMILGEEVSDG